MSQITMFSGNDEIMINKKIRLIELFAGIGSQAKALKNIGADFEHYRICEFDKYAVTSYNAIHGTDFKVSDITKWHAADFGIIEKDKYEYIVTYSFPCQSLSVAGKGEGMAKGSGTRSGLLWEVERLLEECGDNLPQILLMENVDAILFEKNRKHFFQWCNRLEEFGYRNYYQVLNAKDYGIPQNRNRCYMVSIFGDYYYEFPKPIKLELRVKDLLEDEVPEKHYLSKQIIECFINNTINQRAKGNTFTFKPITENDIAGSILTKAGSRPCDNYLADNNAITRLFGIFDKEGQKHQAGSVYDKNGLCPPLDTMQGGYRQPMIISDGIPIKENNSKGYTIAQDGDTINLEQPTSKTRRGRVAKQIAQTLNTSTEQAVVEKELICYNQYKPDGVKTEKEVIIYDDYNSRIKANQMEINTLTQNCGSNAMRTGVKIIEHYGNYHIRKLMPIECFRLMGFTREDFFKVKEAGISDCQTYKQAGNSIVVDVLEAIFRNMNLKGVKRWQE